jgi:hypothetical protein
MSGRNPTDFAAWHERLIPHAISKGYPEAMARDVLAWRPYFEEGFSPEDAIHEDLLHADYEPEEDDDNA